MKRVYTHTFSKEREIVDNRINDYFENLIETDKPDIDTEKYKAWLVLFEKKDNKDSKKEFINFMQHEMQHGTEKVP